MCVNCMMGAATAASGVTGMRIWLAARLSPRMLRWASGGLITAGLVAASVVVPG